MSNNLARDQRRGGRGTVEARKRRRMQPTLMALEDRRLLSTFTVTNNASSGTGSLPYEIGLANTAGGANTIVFGTFFNTAQTITLGGTQLELSTANESVTITGPKAGVTVNAGGLSRVFQVDSGVTASISGMTITDGNTDGNGGGLLNIGTLALTNCTVNNNSAVYIVGGTVGGSGYGGGVYNSGGKATLTNCTVSGNTAEYGGGLSSAGGTTLTLTNCTVNNNSAEIGGGLYSQVGAGGTTTLTNCTVSGNSAEFGGGMVAFPGTTLTLTNCTVNNNSAVSPGVDNFSSAGGGVFIFGGKATLTNCTISGNSAAGAGSSGGGVQTA